MWTSLTGAFSDMQCMAYVMKVSLYNEVQAVFAEKVLKYSLRFIQGIKVDCMLVLDESQI